MCISSSKKIYYKKVYNWCTIFETFVENCPCTSLIQDLLTPHTLCHPNIRAKKCHNGLPRKGDEKYQPHHGINVHLPSL